MSTVADSATLGAVHVLCHLSSPITTNSVCSSVRFFALSELPVPKVDASRETLKLTCLNFRIFNNLKLKYLKNWNDKHIRLLVI